MSAARAVLKGTPEAAGPELEDAARLMGLELPPELAQPPDPGLVDVWADNWPAVRIFMAMLTQVRVGFNGVVGFDYTALPAVEQRLGIAPKVGQEAFDNFRVMEREFIAWHREG
jgi:hypothetical protein